MDDFAQTREADDLFESEFSAPQQPPPSAPTEPRAFSSRGGRGGGRTGLQPRSVDSRNPPKEARVVEGAPNKPAAEPKDAIKQQKVHDRTLSGGVKKAKLTEEELTERMARVKLNNERLVERRRKAEEDENSFQVQEEARKQADATKRIVERKKKVEQERSRKELDDEREKNRQRKLNAVNSREWDSTKTEEDYNPRKGSSQFRRGAYGGVDSTRSRDPSESFYGSSDSFRGSSGGFRGTPGGPRGPSGGHRGSPGGPRGSSGGFRGPPGPPRGAHSSNRGGAASRGASRNSNTAQEWPALPSVSDNAAADSSTAQEDKTTEKDASSANDQSAKLEGHSASDNKTAVAGETPGGAPDGDKVSSEAKVPEKAPEVAALDTKNHLNDNLTPLSPAAGGDSWAEQVESAS